MSIFNIKILLNIDMLDESYDDLLMLLKANAIQLIKLEIRSQTFPFDLEFIADEITIKRFNKLTSEGYVQESISSKSVTFQSDILDEYRKYIDNWLAMNPSEGAGNKLKML